MRFALISLLSILPGFVLAGCLVSGNILYPSIPNVPNDSGGVISSAWHTGSMLLDCVDMRTGTYTNEMNVVGVFAGTTVNFEGVTYNLYKTNVDDVFYFGTSAVDNEAERPFSLSSYSTVREVSFGGTASEKFTMRAMVKIRFYSSKHSMSSGVRNVDSMPLIKGSISHVAYNGSWTMRSQKFSFLANGSSCTLETPTTVNLKQVSVADFPSVGSVVMGGAFILALSCHTEAPSFKVSYTMTDVYDAANTSPLLTLADFPLKAKGIALQVLDQGLAVGFSPSRPVIMGRLSNGAVSKPMSVQYIRTGKFAAPGKVRAAISLSFSYD